MAAIRIAGVGRSPVARAADSVAVTMVQTSGGPRNTIALLRDNLNQQLIGRYRGVEFAPPNRDRLARPPGRFDWHSSGSLPCIPARCDIPCGALDLLWQLRASIDLWEEPITVGPRDPGTTTKLLTDHLHRDHGGYSGIGERTPSS